MSTLSVDLPDALEACVAEQITVRGYGTSGEYLRELIRSDRDRQHLRSLLLEGAGSPLTEPVDEAYFAGLRDQVHGTDAG